MVQADGQVQERTKVSITSTKRVQELPPLPEDTPVWVSTQGQQVPGTLRHVTNIPRSYIVDTPSGRLRRNRSDLRVRSENTVKSGYN